MNDPDRRVQWMISGISALWFTALIAFWAHGGLLYRIDFPGVYSIGGFFFAPTPDYIIPSLAAGVSFGNIYFAQYLSFFWDVFLCTLGAQLLARELFRTSFSSSQLIGLQALAATFYLIEPYGVTWGFYALMLNVFLYNAAFFLVMALLVRLGRCLVTGKQAFRWGDAIWLGVGVGLASPSSFPNLVRTLLLIGVALGILATVVLALVVTSQAHRSVVRKAAPKFTVGTVPVAVALVAYPVWLFLQTLLFEPGAVAAIAAKNSVILPNSFATLPNVVRLFGRSNFLALPYAQLYVSNPAVIVGTWLWPILAVLVPLIATLFPRLPNRGWIWVSELLILPCIAWGTGTNPPFGPINSWVSQHLPYGHTFMPTFVPVQFVAVKLYTVLAAFSIVLLYVTLRRWVQARAETRPYPFYPKAPNGPWATRPYPRRPRRVGARIAAPLMALLVVTLLGLSATPIFNGTVLEAPGGASVAFQVPNAYFATRDYLQAHGGNALLLPSTSLYFRTTWGYYGVSGFYTTFYTPSRILSPDYYGPYQYLLSSTRQSYAEATQVIVPGTNSTPLPALSGHRWIQAGHSPYYVFRSLGAPLNLSSFEWAEVTLPTTDPGLLVGLIQGEQIDLGLRSGPQQVGWYLIGQGGEAQLISSNSTSVEVGFLLGAPTRGVFDPSSVNALILRILPFTVLSSAYFPDLGLGTPRFTGIINSSLAPGWLTLMRSTYHMNYLLLDSTLKPYGRTEPTSYGPVVTAVLFELGLATPVLITNDLQLWQLG